MKFIRALVFINLICGGGNDLIPNYKSTLYILRDAAQVLVTGMRSCQQYGEYSGAEGIQPANAYTLHPWGKCIEILSNIGLCLLLINLPGSLFGFLVGFTATLFIGATSDLLAKLIYWKLDKQETSELPTKMGHIFLKQIPTSLGAGLFVLAFQSPLFVQYAIWVGVFGSLLGFVINFNKIKSIAFFNASWKDIFDLFMDSFMVLGSNILSLIVMTARSAFLPIIAKIPIVFLIQIIYMSIIIGGREQT